MKTRPAIWQFLKHQTAEILKSTSATNSPLVVGGHVRDAYLGRESLDVDLVVEQDGGAEFWARELSARLEGASQAHPLGAGYPIWQVMIPFEGKTYEVQIADSQKEMFPDSSSRQRIAMFGSLEEDCLRRDFTINMLYWDLQEEKLLDLSGQGLSDLEGKQLRCHQAVYPRKIFRDDPLRMIRLFRFHAQLGFSIDPKLFSIMTEIRDELKSLSAERVRDELLKLKTGRQWKSFFESLKGVEILPTLFPELEPMLGCEQDSRFHAEGDVWVHTIKVLENSAPSALQLLTALLHDTGKPATQSFEGDKIRFIGHEKVSEKIANDFLKRWCFPKKLRQQVCMLIRFHLRGHDVEQWKSLKPARKLLREVGDLDQELLKFLEADARASLREDGSVAVEHLPLLKVKLEEAKRVEEDSEKFLLSGQEIMAELGLKAGPEVGDLKERARQIADDWSELGRDFTKADLLEELEKFRLEQ